MVRFSKFLLPALVGAAENSQITKVIDLLKGMKTQVADETKKGGDQAEATENQCIADITQLEGDMKYNTEKAETSGAAKEEGAGKASKLAAEAEALIPKIGQAETQKANAAKAETKRVAAHNKAEAELTESITMCGQAYAVLKRALSAPAPEEGEKKESFLQRSNTGLSTDSLDEIKRALFGLSAVINAAWVNPSDAKTLAAFVQESDELTLSQPQAKTSNYETRSGGILKAIQSMQDQASDELTKLREGALKEKHAFEMLSQDLTSKIELYNDQLSAAKAGAAEAAAASKKAAAVESETVEALEGYKTSLSDTHAFCDKSAAEWEARKTEALEEMDTIQQAVDVLSAKFGGEPAMMLLQMRKRSMMKKGEIDAREKVANVLRQMSQKWGDFSFMQAADSAEKGDPFVKVRKMINDMIVKLEDEQAKEAAKEAKCKADLAKGKTEVKVKTGQLKKLQARADKSSAKVASLAIDQKELSEEIKLLETSKSNWTKNRNAQKAENTATLTEAKESIEALNSAIGILSDFYTSAKSAEESLIQTSTGKLSDKGQTIISILQVAQNDFEKLRQGTEEAEASAQKNYEKEMQDADVSLAKANALLEGKKAEQASIKAMIVQIDEDLGNAQKAWEAANKFLKATQEACANKPMSYEERQAKRKAEIDGLTTALDILSGDAE